MMVLKTPKSNQPITCALGKNSAGVHIQSAVSRDSAGDNQILTVAQNQESFSLPVSTTGTFTVSAVVDQLPNGLSPQLVEQGGPILGVFDDPATLATVFTLEVTA
jgi:hypothetical protein